MSLDSVLHRKHRRLISDSSSDSLSHGERSMFSVLLHGARHAPPGALFVVSVCTLFALVGLLERYL